VDERGQPADERQEVGAGHQDRSVGDVDGRAEGRPAGFAAPLGEKDIRLALAAAETLRVPMPLASLLHDRPLALIARGGEELDWSAIGKLAADDAGLGDGPRRAG
jgi:3-hydroxyisobutyrate dehydrogenase-like beta-hydroxyacid dehydrogenase